MRRLVNDPRTIARDIPGFFDAVFPQLTPGIVAHMNRTAEDFDVEVIPSELVKATSLQKAMLFELGFAAAETLLRDKLIDWASCMEVAIERQRRHFDAKIPESISALDYEVAQKVAENVCAMAECLAKDRQTSVSISPAVPGYEWVASGVGDLAVGRSLIEVKCGNRNFSTSDYRQVVMYWLLSYSASLEGRGAEWEEVVLLNPRFGHAVTVTISDFLPAISSGRSKIDILQTFSSMVHVRQT